MAKDISAKEALKVVKGQVVVGNPKYDPKDERSSKAVRRALTEEDIVAARDYGDRVVVTTIDGQKIAGEKS
jgi:hypothetical protein